MYSIYRNRLGVTIRAMHPDGDGEPYTDEVEIGTLPLLPGQAMTFHFDFGDDWQFNVKLERIEPPTSRSKAPKIVAKHGRAPQQYRNDDGW